MNGRGPEDVAVTADGELLTGVEDGRILRLSPDGRRIEVVADTGGRPLGIEVVPDGRLVVCDAYRGLLSVDPRSATVRTLADQVTVAAVAGGGVDGHPALVRELANRLQQAGK